MTTTTHYYPVPLEGAVVVEGGCDDSCSLCFFDSILLAVTVWQWGRTSRPKHGRVFVAGNRSWTTFALESLSCLSPLHELH